MLSEEIQLQTCGIGGNVINLEQVNNDGKIRLCFLYIIMSPLYNTSKKWHTLISLTKQTLLHL